MSAGASANVGRCWRWNRQDDCLGDLAFNGRPRQTLRGLDSGNTVLYLNSFSKSLVPGLRLGYLLVPGRYEKRLILAKFNADIASPALLQEMLALYLQRGLYAAHLERLVAQYASKRRCMSQAIRASKHLSLPYPEQVGGVFFWVQIPDAVDAVLLWKRLRLQGGQAHAGHGVQPDRQRTAFSAPELCRLPAGDDPGGHSLY